MFSKTLTLALTLGFFSLPAAAQTPQGLSPAAPPAANGSETLAAETKAPRTPPRLPPIGLMADAGVPDGINGSLVYRPKSWLRTHLGGGYNFISKGVRGGVALLPFGGGPSVTLEAGHYFQGNANSLMSKFAGAGYKPSGLLERVGYDYANFHLGLDFGSRRVTFYLHGGMSYVRASVHNVGSALAAEASAAGLGSGTEVTVKQDPIVRAWSPSAKLGLIVYLW
jgi:hypothetical protein